MKLEGKVALITGSSRGIGKAIAEAFANEGASVVVTYKENLKLAKKTTVNFNDFLIVQLDVSKRDSIKKAIGKIIKKYDRIDILVNNAGINKPDDFEDVSA